MTTTAPDFTELAREIADVLLASGRHNADGLCPPGEPMISFADYVHRALTAAHARGRAEGREEGERALAKRLVSEIQDAKIDQTVIDLADHQGVNRHDTAQLGWFACWTEFYSRLKPLCLLTPPQE